MFKRMIVGQRVKIKENLDKNKTYNGIKFDEKLLMFGNLFSIVKKTPDYYILANENTIFFKIFASKSMIVKV